MFPSRRGAAAIPFLPDAEMQPIPTRLKALIALGGLIAVVASFAIFLFHGRTHELAGVDATHGVLIWISCFVPAFLIGWVHLVFARQLFAEAKAGR